MKRIIALLSIIIILAIGWTGVWLFAASQITAQTALLATPANDTTPTITCDEFSVTGFPFRFDATCKNAVIDGNDATISFAQLKATILVYRPTHILAFLEGPLRYSDAFFGTEQELRWTKLEASLRLDGWRLARTSIHGENLEYFDVLLGETLMAKTPLIEMHLLDVPEKHNTDTSLATLAAFARATDTSIPGYNITSGRLTLEAEISQLPDDIRSWANPALLRRWQAAGGQVALTRLEADDDTTSMNISGDVSLSDNGEIQGDMMFASSGLAERFGTLIPPTMRRVIFGNPQDDGSFQQVLTIRGGVVFVGVAPLVTLMPLF